ncbi:unnamed protein product [Cochlearia groenlandica]
MVRNDEIFSKKALVTLLEYNNIQEEVPHKDGDTFIGYRASQSVKTSPSSSSTNTNCPSYDDLKTGSVLHLGMEVVLKLQGKLPLDEYLSIQDLINKAPEIALWDDGSVRDMNKVVRVLRVEGIMLKKNSELDHSFNKKHHFENVSFL